MPRASLEDFLSMFSGGDGYINGKKIKKAYFGKPNFVKRELPDSLIQLEYIKSSGTQYIKTGLSMPEGFRVVMDFTWDSAKGLPIGSYDSASPYYRNFFGIGSSRWMSGHLGYAYFGSPVVNTDYLVDYCNIQGNIFCKINGETQSFDTSGATSARRSSNELFLFAVNYGSGVGDYTSIKLRSCKIYSDAEGTNLVADYVPCKDLSGVIGLYDFVDGMFHTNAGTGTFIAGTSEQIGKAKKFRKGYIGENGVAQLFFGGFDIATMAVSYTGNKTDQIVTMGDGKQYRLLTLTSAGTLTLEAEVSVDVWMCGGGQNGKAGNSGAGSGKGYNGDGGDGAYFNQLNGRKVKTASVVVGSAGGTSSFAGTSSAVTKGAEGGVGRMPYYDGVNPTPAANAPKSTRPFDDSYFTQYPCAGGGGGMGYYTGTLYGSNGGNGNPSLTVDINSKGGTTGGGDGGNAGGKGGNATYYGSGGGGGGEMYAGSSEIYGAGGSGYQGVVFVRIPLEQSA